MSLTSPPSAPPPPPAPAAPAGSRPPSGGPRPHQTGQRWIVLVVGGAAIVGLIIAGGSLFARVDRQGTSFKYGWPYLLIGLVVGLLVGAVVLVAAHQAGTRPTRLETVTVLIVCAAVGGLLGLAFAPPRVEPEDVSPITQQEQQRRQEQYGDLPDGAKAGPIDRDGDGLPDLDENGNPIIGLDEDGDGVIDSYLVDCPEDSPTPRLPSDGGTMEVRLTTIVVPRVIPPDDGQIIDTQCDGTIDAIIPYSDEFLTPPGGNFDNAPLPQGPPSTISPQERADEADQQSRPSSGQLLRFFLIALAVVAVIALAAWLVVAWRGRTPNQDDEPEAPELDLPPPTAVNPNFQRSIEELIEDPDPRNGILAAYGRLLIGFDEIGLGRMPHEGPQEHLDRALAASSTDPVAAKELTSWFTLARFSTHPISEEDRRQAVDALRKVTASMQPHAAAAAPVPAI